MASQANIETARKFETGRVAAALIQTYGTAAMAIATLFFISSEAYFSASPSLLLFEPVRSYCLPAAPRSNQL